MLLNPLKSEDMDIRMDLFVNCIEVFSSDENNMKLNLLKRSSEIATLCILTL